VCFFFKHNNLWPISQRAIIPEIGRLSSFSSPVEISRMRSGHPPPVGIIPHNLDLPFNTTDIRNMVDPPITIRRPTLTTPYNSSNPRGQITVSFSVKDKLSGLEYKIHCVNPTFTTKSNLGQKLTEESLEELLNNENCTLFLHKNHMEFSWFDEASGKEPFQAGIAGKDLTATPQS